MLGSILRQSQGWPDDQIFPESSAQGLNSRKEIEEVGRTRDETRRKRQGKRRMGWNAELEEEQ